jgi:hypothetical protein
VSPQVEKTIRTLVRARSGAIDVALNNARSAISHNSRVGSIRIESAKNSFSFIAQQLRDFASHPTAGSYRHRLKKYSDEFEQLARVPPAELDNAFGDLEQQSNNLKTLLHTMRQELQKPHS